MEVKTYSLPSGWFSITLPDDWEEYDDGDEETFGFFNSKNWTGNLRVTPFHWDNTINSNVSKAAQYIAEEINKNEGAVMLSWGGYDCAFYKKNLFQNEEDLIIYYWNMGKDNDIFICSFTIDKSMEQNINEIELVKDIIKSIV